MSPGKVDSKEASPIKSGALDRALRVTPTVQLYPWGKVGADSIVCRLSGSEPSGPYAELWVGAHPKSPGLIGEIPLNNLIKERGPEVLGALHTRYGELPFLFKILSVGSALSIQAHPNSTLAVELHNRDPKNYPDSNHKPEIGVAISQVELLYGFRPLNEICEVFDTHSELCTLITAEARSMLENAALKPSDVVKRIYTELVTSEPRERTAQIEVLYNRLSQSTPSDSHDKLILSLAKKIGFGDIGLASLYLLNYCRLAPGQGFYIGPNLPHAYLSGDLVECMANSDNVVRAGLTNKFQDLPTLLGMLDFSPAPFSPCQTELVKGTPFSRYCSPANEFEIQHTRAAEGQVIATGGKAELLFCLSGSGVIECGSLKEPLTSGTSLLIPATVTTYRLDFSGGDLYRIVVPK